MLVKVLKTYGGLEGRRVKPGTLFTVGVAHGHLQIISQGRFNQLKAQNLAEEFTQDGAAIVKADRPLRNRKEADPENKGQDGSTPVTLPTNPRARQPVSRRQAKRQTQEDSPQEPRPLSRRNGGQTGQAVAPASSSPADPATTTSTLRQRGTRRGSAGLPSTTPIDSSAGPTASTPAMDAGGVTISKPPTQPDSAAFD